MGAANLVTGLFNLLYLIMESMEYTDFLNGDTNSGWVWPFLSWDSKICCIARMNGWIELIFCWCKFRKVKNYFNNFWVIIVVKKRYGILISEWMDEFCWFFACSYIFRKVKVTLIVIGQVSIVKYWCGLLSHGTLKSAVSQKWIHELSWFFAYSYFVRKVRSYFNSYWVHD